MSMTRTSDIKRVNSVHPMSRGRKNRVVFSRKKTVFMDYSGVVHHEFLPEGQTVNKEYYLSVMRSLREAIRQKRPNLWANNLWILHHDNAPLHNAIVIREHLTKNETNTIQQPLNFHLIWPPATFSYSVDLRNRSADRVTALEMRSWKNRRWL